MSYPNTRIVVNGVNLSPSQIMLLRLGLEQVVAVFDKGNQNITVVRETLPAARQLLRMIADGAPA